MNKKTLIILSCCFTLTLFCVSLILANNTETKVDKITVTYENKKQKEFPVTVTLTKYQLCKMLETLEEERGYGRPADPQDSFTYTSIAKGNQHSEQYSISSTHLAKKPISDD